VLTDAASLHAQFWQQQQQQQQQVLISCSHDSAAALKEAQLLFPDVEQHWHTSSSSSCSDAVLISTSAGSGSASGATVGCSTDVTAAVWPVTDAAQLQQALAALQRLAACGFLVTVLCSTVMLRDGFAAANTSSSSSSSTMIRCLHNAADAVNGNNSMPVLFASMSKHEALSSAPAVLDLWRSTSSNSSSSSEAVQASNSSSRSEDGVEVLACLQPGDAVQLQHLLHLQESCCSMPASFEADGLLNTAAQQQQQQQQQQQFTLAPEQQQQYWWCSRSGVSPQHGLQQLVAVAVPAADMEASLAVLQVQVWQCCRCCFRAGVDQLFTLKFTLVMEFTVKIILKFAVAHRQGSYQQGCHHYSLRQ
jgi:hypothetical protein